MMCRINKVKKKAKLIKVEYLMIIELYQLFYEKIKSNHLKNCKMLL